MDTQLIFQLGTNNWQREGEFAPGSGILHEAHHAAYNRMPHTRCYSVYPSTTQSSNDPLVSVLKLTHEIPICESISPVSSYRFHSMSDEEFTQYREHLLEFVERCIENAEMAEGVPVSLAIAHHSFLNPLILGRINERRLRSGKPRFKLLCFVHGTALKMFAHEKEGVDPDYPSRFLPMMEREGVFSGTSTVDACAAISREQLKKFAAVFADFPSERMILSPNGYDANVFQSNPALFESRSSLLANTCLAPSPVEHAPKSIDTQPDKVIVFCGKFADWKRLDSLLHAASQYEKEVNVATLVIGSGPEDAIAHYHRLAYETLKLRNTFFLGPLPHAEIANYNALADLGVYPSRNEPFGLVFIECMACGTPVIGVNSGGPRDFVTNDVGGLVPECEGDDLVEALLSLIKKAFAEDWKRTKGPVAANYVQENFSVDGQCQNLLEPMSLQKPSLIPTMTSQ